MFEVDSHEVKDFGFFIIYYYIYLYINNCVYLYIYITCNYYKNLLLDFITQEIQRASWMLHASFLLSISFQVASHQIGWLESLTGQGGTAFILHSDVLLNMK